jgi:hypothetical protein
MTAQPVTQFRITVPNIPGQLAKVTNVLLKAKINITGMMTECLGDVSHVRLLAAPEKAVTRTLEDAGFPVLEVPVFEIDLTNRPGQLNSLAKQLAEEDVNILCVYGTGSGTQARLVLAVDLIEKAAPIIGKWIDEPKKALKH